MTISIRAVSGCDLIRDEIDVNVLNKKCGLILAGQRVDLGRHQELLLFLEPVLDPRGVPDLDRNGHREHGGQHDQQPQQEGHRGEVEEPLRPEAQADRLPQQLQGDRGR